MEHSYKGNKKILMLSTFAFFMSFFVWFNMAPFSSTIMEQFQLTKDEIGVLMLVNVALAIPARMVIGMLVDRFGPRKVFSVLLIVMSIPCFVFALSTTYIQLVISRLFVGMIGAGFVVGIRMVSEWFPEKQSGVAQGVYAGWGNFGSAAAAFTLPVLALTFGGENGWRYAVALTGVMALIYGFVYFNTVKDTPDWKEFKGSKGKGALEVTSFKDLIILMILSFPIYGGLGLITLSLQRTGMLPTSAATGLYIAFGLLYLLNLRKIWGANKEGLKEDIPEKEKYSMKQVVVLSLGYFTTFGAELAVVSMLPMFFQGIFELDPVKAGIIAGSFAFTNLVARPAGGWISDTFGRKKTLSVLLLVLTFLYFGMSQLAGGWPLALAVALTMTCSFIGQAGSGAVFSMVPLVKRNLTGQIAGIVGAYGNIGSVFFLAVFNFFNPYIFFIGIGVMAFVCFIASLFLDEPGGQKQTVGRSVVGEKRALVGR